MSRSSTSTTLKGSRRPTAMILSGLLAGLAAWAWPFPIGPSASSGAVVAWGASSGRGPPLHSRSRSTPLAHQVFQRDANGRATIPIELDESVKDATGRRCVGEGVGEERSAFINNGIAAGAKFVDGKLVGVPVGRPVHDCACTIKKGQQTISRGRRAGLRRRPLGPGRAVEHGRASATWSTSRRRTTAGHGAGDGRQVGPGRGAAALAGRLARPGPLGRPRRPRRAVGRAAQDPDQGGRPGPAVRAWRWSSRPACRSAWSSAAHGGTSMEQWDPAKKGEGGNSLYGSMLRQVKLAGGKVKGVLWYQGESDAIGDDGRKVYPQGLRRLHRRRPRRPRPARPAVLLRPDRPVRHRRRPKGWNAVQDAQRRIPDRVPEHGRRLGRSTWSSTT